MVHGVKEGKEAFSKMPPVFRDTLNDATDLTIREVKRHAQARLQASPSIRTRNLYNHVAFSMNRKTGRGRAGVTTGSTVISALAGRIGRSTIRVKGIVTAGKTGSAAGGRIDVPARRAHFVEFGTRHMPAEPFMIPALESQTAAYLDRCRHAGKRAEQTLANIGSRHL